MASDQKLKDLSKQLEETVSRIDNLQKKPSLTSRLGRHFKSQSSHVLNVILTGCVLSVAVGRLMQRNEHELEREKWQDERNKLAQEAVRLQQRGDALEALLNRTKQGVLAELDTGGWRLAPVADRIRITLNGARPGVGQQQQMSVKSSSIDAKREPAQAGERPKIMI